MLRHRYSRWDGTQQGPGPNQDALLESLSEDILSHGDLRRALRSLVHRGVGQGAERIEGLRELLQRLQQQRHRQLERYHLDSVLDEVEERLKDVVDTERRGIESRVAEAEERLAHEPDPADHLMAAMDLLRGRAARSRETLDSLPASTAAAISALRDYEFMDPAAQRKFQELLDLLGRQMLQSILSDTRQRLQGMSPQDQGALRDMIAAINQMLRDRAAGLDPDFEGFMEHYGASFGPDRPTSLAELLERLAAQMAAAQSLLDSMSPAMRADLASLLEAAIEPGLAGELGELAANLEALFPQAFQGREYPFSGDEPLTLQQAMEAMRRLQGLDDLERRLRDVMRKGDIEDLDPERVEAHLGEEARRHLERLQRVVRQLEEAGYLKRAGETLELTPRAVRKLGEQALQRVFSKLKRDRAGAHRLLQPGEGGDPTGESRPLQFGDPFDIELNRTVFNAIVRRGPSVPVRLSPQDMEVQRTEHLTQAATVLLLDQSRSMGMLDNFASAKRVALALHWLTQSQFPRDYFAVVGFSDYAMEVTPEEMTALTWNAWVSGTNMHHALMLSRQLLSKRKTATKQVLMVTDGEPTAHLEGGQAFFGYPPSRATVRATLREVRECTRQGITINVFVLGASQPLMDFVDRVTRLNRGRAFYTTADQLGKYVVVDYLKGRRERLG